MIDTTMIVRKDPRPNLTPPPSLNYNVNHSACLRSRSQNVTCGRRGQVLMKLASRKTFTKNTRLNDKNHSNPVILSKTSVLSVFSVVQKLALKWLCIGFELALFFPPHQLPILAYQSINKTLTAILQMLRLALFSQTKPIQSHFKPILQRMSRFTKETYPKYKKASPFFPPGKGIPLLQKSKQADRNNIPGPGPAMRSRSAAKQTVWH